MSENIEKKWQKKWADEKLFESNPDEREKLFLTVAFPYPSGAMHIGHGRTYTVPDVFARFKRMRGLTGLKEKTHGLLIYMKECTEFQKKHYLN